MAYEPQLPVNLSLVKLFTSVFGVTPSFEPDIATLPARLESNSMGTAYYGTDQFGREVFLPVTISYTTAGGKDIEINLYHAVISLRGSNDYVKTKLTENNGTFKELISGNDWDIEIMGFLVSKTNDFPEDDFKQLVALKKNNTAVTIKNAITDLVLIDNDGLEGNVVVDDVDFPAVRGVQNVKPYTIRLTSDKAFNLYEIA